MLQHQLMSARNIVDREPTLLLKWTVIHTLEIKMCVSNVYTSPDTSRPTKMHTQAATTVREINLIELGEAVEYYVYYFLCKEMCKATEKGMN